MDGASRFTQRDAVAGILITSINIVAGFLIGVLQHGMDLRHAIETYTVLTIGDGLVTVIPALMISVSGGLIVTRASSDDRLGADFGKQLFGNPQPLMLASGVLMVLAAFPGTAHHSVSAHGLRASDAGAWNLRKKQMAAQNSRGRSRNLQPPRRTSKPPESGAPGHRNGSRPGEIRRRRAGIAAA